MAHANRKQVALYLTDEEIEKVTKHAEKIGISRQKLLSNLIVTGLDDLAAMDKVGILSIGVGLRDLFSKFKKEEADSSDENTEQS